MGIASTDTVTGKPTFDDVSTTQADLQALADFADPSRIVQVGTAAALPAAGFAAQRIEVTADPTAGNNGSYVWDGTVWVRVPASALYDGTTIFDTNTEVSMSTPTAVAVPGFMSRIVTARASGFTVVRSGIFQFSGGAVVQAGTTTYPVDNIVYVEMDVTGNGNAAKWPSTVSQQVTIPQGNDTNMWAFSPQQFSAGDKVTFKLYHNMSPGGAGSYQLTLPLVVTYFG